ncbi:MAG: hypothetical protein KY395_07600 [Actinobacteria bacterium]|nr:hypothetical protein [Actinomycetota bacterium]
MRTLASLLDMAEGSPADRARLARTQAEAISLLLEPEADDAAPSAAMVLAAVRASVLRLYDWCPDLREAEMIAMASALCLAGASADLSDIAGPGGPELCLADPPSWDEFIHRRARPTAEQEKIIRALLIKRDLLVLISRLETEAAGPLDAHDTTGT